MKPSERLIEVRRQIKVLQDEERAIILEATKASVFDVIREDLLNANDLLNDVVEMPTRDKHKRGVEIHGKLKRLQDRVRELRDTACVDTSVLEEQINHLGKRLLKEIFDLDGEPFFPKENKT